MKLRLGGSRMFRLMGNLSARKFSTRSIRSHYQ